jgi:drug/metabolite transporter (DMT)-like permease
MTSSRQGQLAGLAAAVLFGCSAPLISTLTGSGSALSIAGVLYAGATLALLAVRLVRGTQAETPIRREDWPALGALTLLGGVVGPVALVLGLARLPAASSSLLLNLKAVFTLAIAMLLGREHLGRRGLVSALLTVAGAVLLSEGSLSGASASGCALIALATLGCGRLPALLSLLGPELQGFLSAQLPAAFEQWHRLIRQQLTAGDLEPLAPAIPEGGPEVQHLPAVADPRHPGRQRWPVAGPTAHATSGVQPRWRCRSSDQPLQRWVRCSPWAIRP